jgi:hypothetical protein
MKRVTAQQLVGALIETCDRHRAGHMSRSTFTSHMFALWNNVRFHNRERAVRSLINKNFIARSHAHNTLMTGAR